MRDYFSFKAKEILGKRPVKQGDVIMTSEPFVYVIDSHRRGQYCDHCIASLSKKPMRPCKVCGVVWYCSDACEIAGSDIHQYECKPLKKLEPNIPSSFVRMLARAIFKLKNGGDKYVEYYGENKRRQFKDLMNHYRDIKGDVKRMKEVRSTMKILKSIVGEQNVPDESDFIGLYGRVLVNRFCLMDENMCPVGSSLYLGASIFDHSCIPNAYASFSGKKVVIRSLVDWPEFNLNKVFISYTDVMNSTHHRRAELKSNWYFWCDCNLCLKNKERVQFENCIKCQNPECGLPVLVPEKPESIFIFESAPLPECAECGWAVEEDDLDYYHSAVAFTRQRLKGLKEDNPAFDVCWSIMEKQGEMFSSMNVWRVKALDSVFDAAMCSGTHSMAHKYGTQNLEGMKYYYGADHPTYGMFLMKLGKAHLFVKEHREGLKYVEEAEKILTIALGPQHRLITDEITRLKVMASEDLEIRMERRIAEQNQQKHELVCKHCGRRKQNLAEIKRSLANGGPV